jgi:hypothetical protein
MRIVGEWLSCDDGITRPVVIAEVFGNDGKSHHERFLIDTGADRTAFSAGLLEKLYFVTNPAHPGYGLQGIGGSSAFVVVTTIMELTCDDGTPARVRGEFAAFTDPAVTDLSILGRDVLDNFDVLASRRRHEVLLLAGHHQYQVTKP